MAQEHNAIKYGAVLSSAASTAVGGAYGDVGVSRLSETLQPTFDLWGNPDWAILRGERLYARSVTSPVVAARFSSIELVNPTTSTKLVVVKRIRSTAAATDAFITMDTGGVIAANAVTVRGLPREGRLFLSTGVQVSICTLTVGDLAAGVANEQDRITGNGAEVRDDWVLVPGTKLFVIASTVASATQAMLSWSERITFPGELQAR